LKTLVRVAILISGAAGFCIAMALAASADVGNPTSAYQSAFKIALTPQAVQAASRPVASAPEAAKPDPAKSVAPRVGDEPVATPVPEQFVSQGPAPVVVRDHRSMMERIVFGVGAKYRAIESFFGRVASATQDGPGAGTGVPVLVLAVLSVAAVVEHHRRHGRWATDGNVLELLYARELTPPG
jgi:hypothetical protein